MRNFNVVIGLILIISLPLLQNCGLDIEETNTNFKWVVKGNTLTYDLNMTDHKIPDYRILEITEDPGIRDNMIFKEIRPEIQDDPNLSYLLLDVFSHVYRLGDGLHTTACFSCNANPCLSVINYLKVPAKPKVGQSIPDYLCGDKVYTHDIVLSIDSLITVPLGQFRTFVINDTLRRSIKFWNESEGLIRVDNYNESLDDTIRLELSKKTF